MLSFMREPRSIVEDSSVQKPPAATGRLPADGVQDSQEQRDGLTQQTAFGEGSRFAKNGAAGPGPEEYLTVAAQNKNARRSTMLLGVLFGMGLLCLWFMIKKSTPQTATGAIVSTEETQIEMAIARLTGVRSEMFNRMDEIVKKFYEFSDVQQVKVDELVKNPFNSRLDARYSMLDSRYSILDGRESRIENQADEMQLMSLMQSEQGNCCMIDDKILYEGDLIKGFKVSQIGDGFVKLEWDPKRNEPRLSEGRDEGRLGTQIILKLSE